MWYYVHIHVQVFSIESIKNIVGPLKRVVVNRNQGRNSKTKCLNI